MDENAMKPGIENLLENGALRKPLEERRVALLGHPPSVTRTGHHTLFTVIGREPLSSPEVKGMIGGGIPKLIKRARRAGHIEAEQRSRRSCRIFSQ